MDLDWTGRSRWSPARRGASARRSRRRCAASGASVMLSSRKHRRPRGGGRRDRADRRRRRRVRRQRRRPRPGRGLRRPPPSSASARVDILVNNAATNPYMGPTMDIDTGRFDKTWQVNLRGPLVWTQPAWQRVDAGARRRRSSTSRRSAGCRVEPSIGIYNATKAALIHLTRTLALELSPGVRVNAHRARPGEDRHGPGAVGAERGGHRPPHAARPPRRAERHRQRRALPAPATPASWITGHDPRRRRAARRSAADRPGPGLTNPDRTGSS